MNCRPLRRLLHCTLDLLADPRHAAGQTPGVRCIQLDDRTAAALRRPAPAGGACGSLQPSIEMCGADRAQAMRFLDRLEHLTAS